MKHDRLVYVQNALRFVEKERSEANVYHLINLLKSDYTNDIVENRYRDMINIDTHKVAEDIQKDIDGLREEQLKLASYDVRVKKYEEKFREAASEAKLAVKQEHKEEPVVENQSMSELLKGKITRLDNILSLRELVAHNISITDIDKRYIVNAALDGFFKERSEFLALLDDSKAKEILGGDFYNDEKNKKAIEVVRSFNTKMVDESKSVQDFSHKMAHLLKDLHAKREELNIEKNGELNDNRFEEISPK